MKTNIKMIFAKICFAIFCISCSNTNQKSGETNAVANAVSQEDLVKRGDYLVTIMGCDDCHSPKKMGPNGPEIIPELRLSGFQSTNPMVKFTDPMIKQGFAQFYPDLTASAGPWGVSFSGNLTPDQTGIGTWTEEQFKIALTQGKFKGIAAARTLLPPMPWINFTVLKDEDVSAIFAFLKSLNPVSNVVPQPIPPDQM